VSRLPYFRWFPDDYAGSVRGWSLLEKGGYREALDAQWSQDGLPANPDEVRRIIGATPAEFRRIWARIESKFPIAEDGRRRNPRLEQERERVKRVSVVRAELGRLGAAKRYGNSHSNSSGNSQSFAMPSRIQNQSHEKIRTPDAASRTRAGPANPDGPPARPSDAMDESDPEIRRRRQEAAELAAGLTEGKKP
jgi:uncharacterized protein YdaU (DUF1376 family)